MSRGGLRRDQARPDDAISLKQSATSIQEGQQKNENSSESQTSSNVKGSSRHETSSSVNSIPKSLHIYISIFILFLNYFLAQYDKFILSYFQDSFSSSLNLTSTQYAVLSGYATGIVYALMALPIAWLADYLPRARVWTLTVAALWWSLCVIFQSLSHNFVQVLLARIAMGIGQAAVAPLSVSLISDMRGLSRGSTQNGLVEGGRLPLRRITYVFLGASVFYVGVYVGEAVSGQIATAFTATSSGWRTALRAIGIVGIVLAVVLRLVLREPTREGSLISVEVVTEHAYDADEARVSATNDRPNRMSKLRSARGQVSSTINFLVRMRSFWLLVISASFRQLAGNVFGYYMPSYLSNTYPSHPELLSRYGIIVGVVGTFSVLGGGILTAMLWNRTKLTPIYLTGIGGLISSVFVLLMIFSRQLAGGNEDRGIRILYGTMAAAYLTAETWLGALEMLVALLLPPQYKTFGLAVWESIQALVYSSGPEIIGLALRNTSPGSAEYTQVTKIALAVIIPLGYWIAGLGFLASLPMLRMDLRSEFVLGRLPTARKIWAGVFVSLLCSFVVALFVASIVYDAM